MNNSPSIDENIKKFVSLFDGDIDDAIQAVNDYKQRNRLSIQHDRPPLNTPVLVNVESVEKIYKIGKTKINALAGVSLQIHEGEFIALTGASGSGKSTLLQLIGGLDKPSAGKIEVVGVNIGKLSDSKLSKFRNRIIGFVFQFFYLQPFLKVKTNLAVPGMFAGTNKKVRSANVKALADAVGIGDRMNHYPRELSGGQMQRAAIARALLNKPKLLLADEPTGNLDSANGKAIIELFEKIRSEFGTTIVIVTHDADIAAMTDREIRLKDGLVV